MPFISKKVNKYKIWQKPSNTDICFIAFKRTSASDTIHKENFFFKKRSYTFIWILECEIAADGFVSANTQVAIKHNPQTLAINNFFIIIPYFKKQEKSQFSEYQNAIFLLFNFLTILKIFYTFICMRDGEIAADGLVSVKTNVAIKHNPQIPAITNFFIIINLIP